MDGLEDLIQRPRTEGLNLLEGAKGALITLGRVKYAWDKDRFLPEHELDSDEIAEEKAAAGIIAGKAVTTGDKPPATPRISAMFGRSKTRGDTKNRSRGANARPPVSGEAQKSMGRTSISSDRRARNASSC